MRPSKLVVGVISIAAILTLACERQSDRYQAEGQTWSNLRLWGGMVESAKDAGIHLESKNSAQEAALHLKSIKAISAYEYSLLKADGWGRPFRWKTHKSNCATILKITSDGKDGTSQGGDGDDLFIEVTIPIDGPIKTYQNRPKRVVLD